MSIAHFFLALLIVIIWGLNFIFIKLALIDIPPFLLCVLRFLLVSIPAIFFIKPPKAPFKMIVLYGLLTFALQFSFLFIGMRVGMTPGIASLLMQVQVFFSMLFAAILLNEVPNPWQIGGAIVSFIGIGLVALHFDSNISLLGFVLVLMAAASWGMGNLVVKKIGPVNIIALVVWGSAVACVPTLIMSLLLEGPSSIINSYHHLTLPSALSVLYIAYLSTCLAYCLWSKLLHCYSVGTVVPFALLIPVIGMLSSVWFFGEAFQNWKWIAGLLVISGLCINLLSPRFYALQTEPRR